MSVMYIVLPLAFLFAGIFVCAFIWAVRHGQLDDLETPAARMLFDDDGPGEGAAGLDQPAVGEPAAGERPPDEGTPERADTPSAGA